MFSRENLKLALVAVFCLLVAWTGPSIAHGVHAQFAHNADKVDGKHATELATRVYEYEIPGWTARTSLRLTFPDLPPGRYLASILIYAITSGSVNCLFANDTGALSRLVSYQNQADGVASVSATGVLDTREGPWDLRCFGRGSVPFSGPAKLYNYHYASVTFLRTDQVVKGSAVVQ